MLDIDNNALIKTVNFSVSCKLHLTTIGQDFMVLQCHNNIQFAGYFCKQCHYLYQTDRVHLVGKAEAQVANLRAF